jgi:hypothetical protein
MYQILLFSGGVYKFDLLEEYVDDAGGLVLREDKIHISRGDYFIASELQVLIVIPNSEVQELKEIAEDIKGTIEKVELDKNREQEFFNYLHIYNLLSCSEGWKTQIVIQEMEDPVLNGMLHDEEQCSGENLNKLLEEMVSLEILESQTKRGLKKYRVHTKRKADF